MNVGSSTAAETSIELGNDALLTVVRSRTALLAFTLAPADDSVIVPPSQTLVTVSNRGVVNPGTLGVPRHLPSSIGDPLIHRLAWRRSHRPSTTSQLPLGINRPAGHSRTRSHAAGHGAGPPRDRPGHQQDTAAERRAPMPASAASTAAGGEALAHPDPGC